MLVVTLMGAVVIRLDRQRGVALRRGVASAAAAVAVAQLVLEGPRWQLAPAYALTGVVALLVWRSANVAPRSRRLLAGWLVGLGLAAGLPVALPIPTLPEPDGPYAVGTTTVVVTDESRLERYGPDPGGARSLPLHVWYPAEQTGTTAPGWLDHDAAAIVAESYGLPLFFLDHLRLTPLTAVPNAPIAGGERFPVILYSHGWGGFGRISPDQPELLASHGYVVVAPDHTYGALIAEFPSGIVGIDEGALPEEDDVGEDAFDAAATALVETYASDLRFVLDVLEASEAVGLASHIDLDRVGIYGHSTGGGGAVAACLVDDRCDAVVGLDPWVEPVDRELLGHGLDQPFLALRSDDWVGESNDEVLLALHAAGGSSSVIAALSGANHYDFVALSQISPLTRFLGFTGSIPAPIARYAIGESLVSFFDAHLQGGTFRVPALREIRVDFSRP